MNLNQVTLPAADIEASKAFYRGMGFIQIVDSARYARFECPQGQSTFSLHQHDGDPAGCGVVVYFETADLDHKVSALIESGFEFDRPPRDERWLWREARLRDPAGNVICLYWAGENRRNPPWRLRTAATDTAT